ncbi:MAG: hypothetical protein ACJ8H8_36130 [Geminicoccaceae bacterium]
MKDGPALCPSGKCEPGAKLLGLVQQDGTIGYLGDPLEIDAEFVDRANQGRTPERRFRFVNPCAECGCRQWTGTRCGVIDRTLEELAGDETQSLPRCGIRPHCRWFRQNGADACRVCSLVITDTRQPDQVGETA